jgi:hypothetical protein
MAMASTCAAHVSALINLRLLRDVGPAFARYAELLQGEARNSS